MNLQAKILKAIDNKVFNKVGSEEKTRVDVRVITASNKDIEKMVEDGTFRKDLYYRINQNYFYLPPLRERREDYNGLGILDHWLSYTFDAKIISGEKK